MTVAHNTWPDYMNAMQYATKDANGNITTYIFLKANAATRGSTDKDTRLNLIPSNGGSITKVEMFDVDPTASPNQRDALRSHMIGQTVDQYIGSLGASVLNVDHWSPIKGKENVYDKFTKNTGYQISLPAARLRNDWGFLVKVTGKGDSLTYDWLTDKNTGDEAMLRNQKIEAAAPGSQNKETVITVTNEAFETRPVEVKKYEKTGQDQYLSLIHI